LLTFDSFHHPVLLAREWESPHDLAHLSSPDQWFFEGMQKKRCRDERNNCFNKDEHGVPAFKPGAEAPSRSLEAMFSVLGEEAGRRSP
jgi:hypothetical protein